MENFLRGHVQSRLLKSVCRSVWEGGARLMRQEASGQGAVVRPPDTVHLRLGGRRSTEKVGSFSNEE